MAKAAFISNYGPFGADDFTARGRLDIQFSLTSPKPQEVFCKCLPALKILLIGQRVLPSIKARRRAETVATRCPLEQSFQDRVVRRMHYLHDLHHHGDKTALHFRLKAQG